MCPGIRIGPNVDQVCHASREVVGNEGAKCSIVQLNRVSVTYFVSKWCHSIPLDTPNHRWVHFWPLVHSVVTL